MMIKIADQGKNKEAEEKKIKMSSEKRFGSCGNQNQIIQTCEQAKRE